MATPRFRDESPRCESTPNFIGQFNTMRIENQVNRGKYLSGSGICILFVLSFGSRFRPSYL